MLDPQIIHSNRFFHDWPLYKPSILRDTPILGNLHMSGHYSDKSTPSSPELVHSRRSSWKNPMEIHGK